MINIKESVKNNVVFSHYKDGELWYKDFDSNLFPVPVADVGTATFLSEDKGMLFMRYMRKWNEISSNSGS